MKNWLNTNHLGAKAAILIAVLTIIGADGVLLRCSTKIGIRDSMSILMKQVYLPPLASEVLAYEDWTVQDLDGNYLSIAELKGKVAFLNFWATWCPPCIVEMPSIQRLYEKIKNDRVIFACITPEDISTVKKYMRQSGVTLPLYTMRGKMPELFDTDVIPTTYILSPDGQVALKHIGTAKWDNENCIELIKSLMQQ
jgi:thiol-disulfide isomerase/thioredoxin